MILGLFRPSKRTLHACVSFTPISQIFPVLGKQIHQLVSRWHKNSNPPSSTPALLRWQTLEGTLEEMPTNSDKGYKLKALPVHFDKKVFLLSVVLM